MKTLEQIKANYKTNHDALTAAFYDKKRRRGVTKAEQAAFDTEHAAIYRQYIDDLKANNLYTEPPASRDLAAELDALKTDVNGLKTTIKSIEVKS